LWTTANFHWDGSIGPCCLQFKQEDDFGSINESSFKSVWNNEKFVYARSLFAHKRKNIANKQDVICNRCYKVVPEKKI
jgi:radical SAM protein with 4Fe4S-binding SPASM domain